MLCEFLQPETAVTGDKYCETPEKLCEAIKRSSPGRLTARVRLLHDGT
jgi:hypothetical protein